MGQRLGILVAVLVLGVSIPGCSKAPAAPVVAGAKLSCRNPSSTIHLRMPSRVSRSRTAS